VILKILAVALMAFSALVMAGMVIAALIAFRRWLPTFVKQPKAIFLGFVEDNWKGAAFLLAFFVVLPFVWIPLLHEYIDNDNARIAVGVGVPVILVLVMFRRTARATPTNH